MRPTSRRDFLLETGGGFGALALSGLLANDGLLAADEPTNARVDLDGGRHHRAKVRRVIQLFMNGGASPMDTFDFKPELIKRHGEKVDFGLKAAATSVPGSVMMSPFVWRTRSLCWRSR